MTNTLLDKRTTILATIRENAPSPRLLDIGCGQNPEEGFVGIDLHSPLDSVEKVDLYAYPWQFPDGSVDYFRASHFLEHVPDWDAHFTEVYRCLKSDGYYEIISPFYLNHRWWQDPDHKQPILQERFMYLSHEWRKAVKMDHYGAAVNFKIDGWFELFHPDYLNAGFSEERIAWDRTHSFNVIDDIACILKKLPMEEAVPLGVD